MRVLVIGFPLPNPQIDNYSFVSAPSFFDYDAVVVEPASVSTVIEQVLTRSEDHQTFAGEPVLNEPSGPFVVGLTDHLQRRREETERLLAAGKMLVIFARPNVPHSHILGFPGYDRYSWLPAPPGAFYRPPQLMAADGRGAGLVDRTHPLAALIDRFQNWFTYRAYFSDRSPAFPESGRVLMRSPGGAAIAVELRVGPGRIVFLPALEDVPAGDPRFELATELMAAVKRAHVGETEADAPRWVGGFTLPGLEELENEERAAKQALEEAQARLSRSTEQVQDLAGLRRLLWSEGRYALDAAVREALRRLEFVVDQDVDKPGAMYADGRTAFFEVQGDRETVTEDVYIRLQRRIEKDMLVTAEPKKGVVVVNGQRRSAPDKRAEPFTRALQIACENNQYALITGPVLFELTRRCMETPLLDERRHLRDLIFETAGVLQPPEPEQEEAPDAAPPPDETVVAPDVESEARKDPAIEGGTPW